MRQLTMVAGRHVALWKTSTTAGIFRAATAGWGAWRDMSEP
jgi:hypothetical protein